MNDTLHRRVLVIAYYFPPMGLSGVQRTVKFVKYLPHFGWHPTVLTVQPGGYFAHDDSLLDDLSSREIRVVRTLSAGPGKLFDKKEVVKLPSERMRKLLSRVSDTFFIPDNKVGWKSPAVRTAIELHEKTPFDLVFVTGPPFSSFLAGADVKEQINKPLVFDYRDPWVEYPFKFYPTPLHRWRNTQLERRCLKASSHVITTNRRVKEILLKHYPFLSYHDVDIIPQGFDPDDFAVAPPKQAKGKRQQKSNQKMRITYAGVFWEDRVPDYFLHALSRIFQEKPKLRGNIEACFIGHFREENVRLVNKLGLQDTVNVVGYLPHKECVQQLMQSDVLWMIVGDDLGSPGKAYEYIGARKPILGCVPDGFMKSMILEAGGKVVAPNDVEGIKVAVEEFYAQFRRGELQGPPPDVYDKYNRLTLTQSLVRVFESLFAL